MTTSCDEMLIDREQSVNSTIPAGFLVISRHREYLSGIWLQRPRSIQYFIGWECFSMTPDLKLIRHCLCILHNKLCLQRHSELIDRLWLSEHVILGGGDPRIDGSNDSITSV